MRQHFDTRLDLVPRGSEGGDVPPCCRIGDRLMEPSHRAGNIGADLFGAERHDQVGGPGRDVFERFRPMPRDVDTCLGQSFDGERV
jgi:hypothetical protein